jgi:hypothetical protein
MDEPSDLWSAARRDATARSAEMLAFYRLLRETGELGNKRLLAVRCRRGRCLLLDIFQTPVGPAVCVPRVKFSESRNASTSPAARETRTTDGQRRWNEHADLLEVAGNGWTLSCDHALDRPLMLAELQNALARHEREMLI